MFLRLLKAELLKMREPMTLLAFLGGPALLGVLTVFGAATRDVDYAWASVWRNVLTFMWPTLLFPFAAIGIAAFAAQIEHRAKAWDHLLTLPVPKWAHFWAKALVVALAGLATYPLTIALVSLGGALGGLLSPHGQFGGPFGLETFARPMALAAGASLFLIAAQLWVSLRFAQFIVPVMVGIGGIMVMLMSNAFDRGDLTTFFPWGLPSGVMEAALADASPDLVPLFAVGFVGGLLALVAMCVVLARREFR
jgi:ABC-2 type transport system permease protein